LDIVIGYKVCKILSEDPFTQIIIVSKDNGYLTLANYLKSTTKFSIKIATLETLLPSPSDTDLQQTINHLYKYYHMTKHFPKTKLALSNFIDFKLNRAPGNDMTPLIIKKLCRISIIKATHASLGLLDDDTFSLNTENLEKRYTGTKNPNKLKTPK
jgi:hypothetical protein